jgi:glycosyltransferase involved in cell wall biosynthesis
VRILNLVHQYLPERVGGTELYTQAIAGELATRGHEIGLLYRSDRLASGLAAREDGGVRVWSASAGPLSPLRRFLATYRNPVLQGAFEQVLDRFRPDVVHVQHLMGWPAGLASELLKRGIPYIITLWDFWWRCANAQLLTNYSGEICDGPNHLFSNCARCAIARAGHPRLYPAVPPLAPLMAQRNRALSSVVAGAARLVAPTEFVRQWYTERGLPVDRLVTLPPALAYSSALPPQPTPRPFRVIYIGGLSEQKGVHALIEAFNDVAGDAELVIAGDDTADPAYSSRLRALAGQNVRFLGRLDRAGVWRALSEADLVAVPTLWYETYSFIISEAFAAGLPVLASRLGPIADRVRDGVDGLLLPPGDVPAWRAALRSLVHSPERLAILTRGVEPPQTLEQHADDLETLFASVLAEAG